MMTVKQVFLVMTIVLFSQFSCEYAENNESWKCDTTKPLEDIPWLKKIKESFGMRMMASGAQIIRYKYKGDYVFWIDPCYHCADGLITVYDCQGEVICEFGGIAGKNTCIDFKSEASDSTMLFNNVQE